MLWIDVPLTQEGWDDENEVFIEPKIQRLQLEHSLVSLSKWESKWCKPFLSKDNKTEEETLDYIRCMTITQNVDPDVYNHLTNDIVDEVNRYIDAKMTATWFSEREKNKAGKSSAEQVTSEIIYYWMIAQNIPFKCEKWHLNRLLTLIRVCDIKGQPDKKMSKREAIDQTRTLNKARRAKRRAKGR